MADDKKNYNQAKAKWEQLRRDRVLSVAPDVGVTAITIPFAGRFVDPYETKVAEARLFADEAERIAERLRSAGREAQIHYATTLSIPRILRDRDVSSVYTIGHGTLGTFHLGSTIGMSWSDVSRETTHLKTGEFVQRQCGNLPLRCNSPFGMFALADIRKLHAAVGAFLPEDMTDDAEEKIKPVFKKNRIPGYEGILRRFPFTQVYELGKEPAIVVPTYVPPF